MASLHFSKLADLFSFESVIYIVEVWLGQKRSIRTTVAGSLEKEDAMWIVYLVVVLVGLVFGVLCLTSLQKEA